MSSSQIDIKVTPPPPPFFSPNRCVVEWVGDWESDLTAAVIADAGDSRDVCLGAEAWPSHAAIAGAITDFKGGSAGAAPHVHSALSAARAARADREGLTDGASTFTYADAALATLPLVIGVAVEGGGGGSP